VQHDVRFPPVMGMNLAGADVRLPEDLQGRRNLLVIAFRRSQQEDVDTWLPFADESMRRHSDVRFFELPVLATGYRLARPWIDGGMRAGIPDPGVRARTITLYLDKAWFRGVLELPSEDRIYALIADRTGHVVARADGVFTAAKAATLEPFLAGGDEAATG